MELPVELTSSGIVRKFLIELNKDSANNFYHAGNEIVGTVHLTLNKDMDADTHVELSVSGKYTVIFAPTVQKKTVFLELSLNKESVEGELLQTGDHSFAFSINLLPTMPSSIESNWVRVRYSVEARLLSGSTEIVSSSLPIIIYDNNDLNLNPENKMQVLANYQGNPGTCCLPPCGFFRNPPPPSIECFLSLRGFTPFSFIPMKVVLCNEDDYQQHCVVRSIEFQLVQIVTLGSYCKRFVIRSNKQEGLILFDGSNKYVTIENGLSVPQVPPSGKYPEIDFSIEYKIKFVIRLGGRARPISLSIPINIGTIPITAALVGMDVPF